MGKNSARHGRSTSKGRPSRPPSKSGSYPHRKAHSSGSKGTGKVSTGKK